MTEPDYDPVAHYDRILAPWHYLLGDELHYGVFAAGDEPLPVATNALTQRMIDAADLARACTCSTSAAAQAHPPANWPSSSSSRFSGSRPAA